MSDAGNADNTTGRKKPGPKPDPTKPRSRHNPDNPSRSRPKKPKVERTHCKNGHALTEDNVYMQGTVKACKTCRREATYRSRRGSYGSTGRGQGWNNAVKTHCPKGHPYDDENTYVNRGKRICRACASLSSRRILLTKYGLSQDDFDSMIEHQGSGCAICASPFEKTPHIDHDHVTGAVRGLLCYSCNVAIGNFRDDPQLLLNAAKYLMDSWRLETDSHA